MDRKKLYRKRTREEVAKSLKSTVERAEYTQDTDPAKETADISVDTLRYSTGRSSEAIKSYSRKLKDRPINEEKKPSGSLKNAETRASPSASKKIQKEMIKRDYAKAAAGQKTVKGSSRAAEAGRKFTGRVKQKLSTSVKNIAGKAAANPFGAAACVLGVIILLTVMCTLNSCSMTFGGVSGGSISATYTAEDTDIYGAEADYAAKEAEILEKASNAAALYPGYDEYRYNIDSVYHDPWNLTSALTVVHADYTRSQAQGTIGSLFSAQYYLDTQVETETRYKTEERTGYYEVCDYDEEGNMTGSYYESYTYTVEVPYDYNILTVTLVNRGFDLAVESLGLDEDTKELYDYLNQTKGEKAYLF